MNKHEQEAQDRAIEMSKQMSQFVNSFSRSGAEAFVKAMACEHRTLQQSFTRLVLQWLEHVASDEYRTDPRNENSKKIAKQLLEGFKKEIVSTGNGYTTLEQVNKNPDIYLPSKWLPMI